MRLKLFFIDGESKKWNDLYDLDSNNELFSLIELVSNSMSDELFGQYKDELIDIQELLNNNI
jgi:hypothetical protein